MTALLKISDRLVKELTPLRFGPPVTHVYNPLVYARLPYSRYLELYGDGEREVVLLGMNPGPFGMAQTGVPFGEVRLVREWLGVEAAVGKPRIEHDKRPVDGFACERSEVSGARLWGWAKERFGTPQRFFSRFFVANYCPLVFMEESGKNRTPDKLAAAEREALYAACDRALVGLCETLRPKLVVGVGAFAEARAQSALAGRGIAVARIPHPSPASPLANSNWAAYAEEHLRAAGVAL